MSHSVCKVRARSAEEIERLAFNIIEAFQPEAVKMVTKFDVESYFELELENQTGVEALDLPLPNGLDGYTDSENMLCVISRKLLEYDEFDNVTRRRLRATQAHEIGHCHLHVADSRRDHSMIKFHHNGSSLKRYKPEDLKAYQDPEWQAWRFASALLMPECCFRAAIQKKWTKRQMINAFDVNPSFIDVRMKELKISNTIKNG